MNQQTGNDRPISILYVISKLPVRAMYNRVENFLNKNDQFGFRQGLGTNIAIAELTNQIKLA